MLLAFGVFAFVFYKRFVIYPPSYNYSAPKDLKEAQQQDLEYLALYPEYDKSFDTDAKKDAFLNGVRELRSRLPITANKFEMEVARIVANADNTHTNVGEVSRARRLNAIPLRFYWFSDGLYIVLAQEPYLDLLGSKVIAINDETPEALLTRMKPWFGGAKESFKHVSPLFFMSPDILSATGFSKSNETISLTCQASSGKTQTYSVSVTNNEKDLPGYNPEKWLNPSAEMQESNWKGLKPKSIALPFQFLEYNVHHEFLKDVLYVQYNESWNSDNRNVKGYLKDVVKEAETKKLSSVIFDLRFNPGGNYQLARPFLRKMKLRLSEGQPFYIITGNGTFSAGLITAALAKHKFGDQAVILGEKVGDRMQFWADGGAQMTLPNSKINLYIYTAFSDWENGCDDWGKCFWITIIDGVAAGKLNLQHSIKVDFLDFMNGKDSVLEYILSQE